MNLRALSSEVYADETTMPLPHRLRFYVYGVPAPQGSKRHVGNGVMVESSKRLPVWREDVKHAALAALDANPQWDRTARIITAQMWFVLPRPRHHYRTGKNAHLLRDAAPHLHTTKPDLDKLLRSTGDALTSAGVYPDDACMARIVAAKVYADNTGPLDRPGAWITLWEGEDE